MVCLCITESGADKIAAVFLRCDRYLYPSEKTALIMDGWPVITVDTVDLKLDVVMHKLQ